MNKDKLFSYDENILFGHNKEAFKPSMFNYVMSELNPNKPKMPLPKKGGQYERSEFAGIPPSELWLKEKHEELKNLDPQKRRQISIYSELENTTKEQYGKYIFKH